MPYLCTSSPSFSYHLSRAISVYHTVPPPVDYICVALLDSRHNEWTLLQCFRLTRIFLVTTLLEPPAVRALLLQWGLLNGLVWDLLAIGQRILICCDLVSFATSSSQRCLLPDSLETCVPLYVPLGSKLPLELLFFVLYLLLVGLQLTYAYTSSHTLPASLLPAQFLLVGFLLPF